MNDKEEFFAMDDPPTTKPGGKRKRKRSPLGPFLMMILMGCAFLILCLVVIDATNSGGKIKSVLIDLLGGNEESPEATKPTVIEKVVEVPVEVPVEKVVERVVEKIVEVKPPMPSGYVSWKKIDLAELWSEIPVKTKVVSEQGETAVKEREREESYEIEMTLKLTIPKPNQSATELAAINDHLPKILKDFDQLVKEAKVSPFYHHLYELKTTRIQQKVTRMDQLLSRHNLYDCETVLQIKHPETGQKLLLVQGEMDVVSDGSDGDRWPGLDDYISMSQHYQPFTSYGWGKRTKTPNPLLERWESKLKEYEEEFAIPGLSAERNRFLREQIETYKAEVADMKARSYLIAEADPFFVLPLSFLGRKNENEFGPAIGDYGVIVYGDKLFPAIAGDAGPSWKFGEASLRIARHLNEKASPYNRPVSELDITYLIFPGSADPTKGPPDLKAWHARCTELLEGIGGIGEGYELHQWEDLIAKKKAEQEAAAAEEDAAAEGAKDEKALPKPESEEAASESKSEVETPADSTGDAEQ